MLLELELNVLLELELMLDSLLGDEYDETLDDDSELCELDDAVEDDALLAVDLVE